MLPVNFPKFFLESLRSAPGFDEERFVAAHENVNDLVSIRYNPAKPVEILNSEKTPWSSYGYYLPKRPLFTIDPLFHAGAYYVQEASSMFLEEIINQNIDKKEAVKVLDLCAAPGGKSTLLQSILHKDSFIVCNETIKQRANILEENITKWGAHNVVVTNNDPSNFKNLKQFFDVIVIDAPCSGSGLFRKDKQAMDEWDIKNVEHCSSRQQRILTDILPSLKHDGILIYSTCSYSEGENENIVDMILENCEMQSIAVNINKEWGILETISKNKGGFGYRFYPYMVRGEGFFIAAFKNNASENVYQTLKPKSKIILPAKSEMDIANEYLKNSETFFLFKQSDEIIAFPKTSIEDLWQIQNHLFIKKAGINLGKIIKQNLVPNHALAMSPYISDKFDKCELDIENALQYLRRKDLALTLPSTKGWILFTYKNIGIGFAKILSNRINNYYPPEWRILIK